MDPLISKSTYSICGIESLIYELLPNKVFDTVHCISTYALEVYRLYTIILLFICASYLCEVALDVCNQGSIGNDLFVLLEIRLRSFDPTPQTSPGCEPLGVGLMTCCSV